MRLLRVSFCGLSADGLWTVSFFALLFASFSIRAFATNPSHSQAKFDAPGIAWDVRGTWHAEGVRDPILTGDVIEPGSLLQPSPEASGHSITILLADGQEVLYECFTVKACARGFRVPTLFHAPTLFAAEMLGRIRAVLVQQRDQIATRPARRSRIARDEVVDLLGPGKRIEIGGLAAALPNGQYFGELQSLGGRHAKRSGIPLEKSGRTIALRVPGPGLYVLTVFDSRKWPRIQFMVAVPSAQNGSVARDFQKEHALLARWNSEYFGWPMHAFQRAYLKSLMLHVQPVPFPTLRARSKGPAPSGVTAEPTFSPRPGYFAGDIAVTLHCAAPGAVIHYSIDTTQPLENSPTYHAPIIVKDMPFTVKAFAESPGKKPSAVVTGNFRIKHD